MAQKDYPEKVTKRKVKELKELLSSHTVKGKYNNMKWLKNQIKSKLK